MQNKKNVAGFIFIEATIAVMIISTIVLFSIRGITNILDWSNYSNNLIQASLLSKEILFRIEEREFQAGETSGVFNTKFAWQVKKEFEEEDLAKYDYLILWKNKSIEFTTYQYEVL